jgi:Exo70 exocyst complex subunit
LDNVPDSQLPPALPLSISQISSSLFNLVDFERIFEEHKDLCIVDPRLRDLLQQEVAGVFLPFYRKFYDKYSKIRFSKKHQNEYTKYSPLKIEELLNRLYVDVE